MLFLLTLAVLIIGAESSELVTGLESSSLLVSITEYVLSSSNGTKPKTICEEQLVAWYDAWQENDAWALKAFDASGRGYNNFILGDRHWLGNWFTCRAVNEKVLGHVTTRQGYLLERLAPFPFTYRMAYVQANSNWQLNIVFKFTPPMHIGLCLPRSCAALELNQMIHETLAHGGENMQQSQLLYTKPLELSDKFFNNNAYRLMLVLLVLLLLLTVLGSCGFGGESSIIACFNAATNWQRLWHISAKKSQDIACINGLRVYCAFALFIVHIIWYKAFSMDQSAIMVKNVANLCMQHFYLVAMLEIFFVISGFLTVINFLRDEHLQRLIAADTFFGNMRRILKQVLHRYLRLAPLEFIILLVTVVCFVYQRETSIFHLAEPVDEICQRLWWQNVLFIQNFAPIHKMCGNWTWTLAIDLQMYTLTIILLCLYTRHPKFVRCVTVMLLVSSVSYMIFMMYYLNVGIDFDAMSDHSATFYTNSIVRMLTYFIGVCYGYAHVYGQRGIFELVFANKFAKFLLGVVIVGLSVAAIISEPNMVVKVPLALILRLSISFFASYIILCSFKVDQCSLVIRWIVKHLESNHLVRMGRVTFAFYLLNPLIILNFYYSLSDQLPADVSVFVLVALSLGLIVLGAAFVVTLLIEIPINRLTNLLLPWSSPKPKST